MRSKLNLIFSILLFFAANRLHAQISDVQVLRLNTVLKKYDQFVDQKLSELGAPGAAIAIVHGDSVVYMKCFGVRELGRPETINSHTVFRIASLSKGFAAVLAGLLVQDGLLRWDDRVIRYLPDFALKNSAHTQNLTIRNILSHTTGLPSHTFDNLLEANVPFTTIVDQLKTVPTISPVGESYNYQNVIYSLIGNIIQAVSGSDYERLMRTRLFAPLGMKEASLDLAGLITNANHASPHIKRRSKWTPTEITEGYYFAAPAAGINASISDMAQWLRAMLGGMPKVVSPKIIQDVSAPVIKTRRELRRYHWNGRARHAYYGLGWRIFDYANAHLIFHSGGLRGYVGQIGFIPEQNIGIVVLLNASIENIFVSTFLDMYFSPESYISKM